MIHLSPSDLRSIESSATAAAHYLDACDFGARSVKLDPTYYRACGELLGKVFAMLDPAEAFPDLLLASPAAREVAEAQLIGRRIELSVNAYYPELALLLNRTTD